MSAGTRRRLLLASAVLVVLAVAVGADVVHGGLLTGLDTSARAAGEASRSAGLTPVVELVSDLGTTPVRVVLAAALAVPLAARWRSWRPVVLAALAVALSPAVSASAKRLVGRARPPAAAAIEAPGDPSFPSGHATASACLATALAALALAALRAAWARALTVIGAAALALAVGLSRVYLGAHWATDVLAGWCTGAALALLLVALVHPAPPPTRIRPGAPACTAPAG